jgi:hypothetical protein
MYSKLCGRSEIAFAVAGGNVVDSRKLSTKNG